jgi:hypothetical protein
MGTRGLTMVVSDGDYKIAQYGQWDHYPEGNGVKILNFIKTNNLSLFKEKLKKIRFVDNDEINSFLKSIESEDGWLTGTQSDLFNEKYPFLSRGHGPDILPMIVESDNDEILLKDSLYFAGDSLFCEWAYIIDLDKEVFEVYRGFNTEPLTEEDRFSNIKIKDEDKEYFQVRLLKSFNLNELPSDKNEFLKQLGRKNDDDQDE